LDDAISGEIDVLIASKFTVTDEDYETKTISSSTQECGAYVFHPDENKAIRLIDTPGIGDTRGIEYDKQNFENILNCISQYDHLNGICILLKPNNARLNIIFKYCIQELLSHLHKSAKDNIVFCFTNTRGTFFRPGDTLPVLKKQLEEIQQKSDIEIKICKDTIYCFDNESFRFLAAVKKGIIFTDKENFSSSWETSANELVRLFQYIKNRKLHKIIDTISLNNARQRIMILCKPLAEVNRNIQENIAEVKKLKEELQKEDITADELKNKLYIPTIELKITLLDRPKVECTKSSCKKNAESCHVKWKMLNVFIQKHKHNGTMLLGKCTSCHCPAKNHKAISYESKSNYSKKFDENITRKISEDNLDQIDKENHIKMLHEKINQLKVQQDMVDDVTIQFTQFLMQNAIASFNDSYAECLDYIIHFEKNKLNTFKDYNNEILEGLEKTKRKYDENVNVIKKMIENGEPPSRSPSIEDIFKLEQQLYSLPNINQYLRNVKKEEEKTFKYRERHYVYKASKDQNYKLPQLLNALTKIFQNTAK
ncbi:4293_t:CDS:2, partial [Gigaspora margarita]